MTEQQTQLAIVIAIVKRAPDLWPSEIGDQLGYAARRMSSEIRKQIKTTETP
jgi:hypothetical protein